MSRRRRYQQGIWTDGPGVAPTMWSEPEGPRVERFQLPTINAGVSPNYGKVDSYLDTMPSRYEPEKSVLIGALQAYFKKKYDDNSTGISPSGGGVPPRTPSGGVPPTSPPAPPPPPTSTTPTGRPRRPRTPGLGTPPVDADSAVSGLPTPPPPAPISLPPTIFSPPPFPTAPPEGVVPPPPFAGSPTEDLLTVIIRGLPEEPSRPTGAVFVDEPENPFPTGSHVPGSSAILDPSVRFGTPLPESDDSLKEWLVSPPATRTHRRTRKK